MDARLRGHDEQWRYSRARMPRYNVVIPAKAGIHLNGHTTMSDTQENDDNLLAPLHEFHQRSQQLLELARAGDWATLEQRLAEREAGLPALGDSQFLIDVAQAGLADELRQGIAQIQALNDRIAELAIQRKDKISAELKESQHVDKSIQAYQNSKAGR